MSTRSKKSTTPCRAKARRRAAPRSSAALRDAISGRGAKRTAPRRSASSATRILSASNGPGGGKFDIRRALAAAIEARNGPARRRLGQAIRRLHRRRAAAAARCALIEALHARGFEIAVETNGTIAGSGGTGLDLRQPQGRRGARAAQRRRAEAGLSAAGRRAGGIRALAFRHFFLQPMDGPRRDANTQARAAAIASTIRTGG